LRSLLDVDECVSSGYNILREPEGSGMYTVAYRLDDEGRDLLVSLGRSAGQCGTCNGNGSLKKGFRAEVTGVVTSLGSGTVSDPPTLRVTSAVPSNGRTGVCSGGQPPAMAPSAPSPPSSSARSASNVISTATPFALLALAMTLS
jgi:hypothetical protein